MAEFLRVRQSGLFILSNQVSETTFIFIEEWPQVTHVKVTTRVIRGEKRCQSKELKESGPAQSALSFLKCWRHLFFIS